MINNIADCPRCGGKHDEIEFKNFKRPCIIGNDQIESWGICPTTNEPIISYYPVEILEKLWQISVNINMRF